MASISGCDLDFITVVGTGVLGVLLVLCVSKKGCKVAACYLARQQRTCALLLRYVTLVKYPRGLWGVTTVGYNPSIIRWHYMQEQGLISFDVSIVTLLLLCSQEAMVRGTGASGVCNKGCCDLL